MTTVQENCQPCYFNYPSIPIREYVSIEDMIKLGCDYFNTDFKTIKSKSRERGVCEPRQMIMTVLSLEKRRFTLKMIGEAFGKKATQQLLMQERMLVIYVIRIQIINKPI